MSNNPPPQPLPRWLPLALLALTLALLFYRLLAGQVLFWGLPALQFYPWREFAISELHAGRLPLWNPYNGAGAPLFANYQSALLYPPNLLALLIPGPQIIGWLGIVHLFWAGLGMWLLTGELDLSTLGRGVGLLAFALNTAFVARFGTPPMIDVAAWLPWLILAVERVIRRRVLIDPVFLALVAAMQLLAGHAQWTFYSLVVAGLYTLYRLFVARIDEPSSWLRPLILIGVGIGLGVGIAGAQLIPTAELQGQSQRSGGVDLDFALNYSYEWPALLMQFNPFFFGNPGDGSYFIPGAYFETASYIGLLPFLLAILVVGHTLIYHKRIRPTLTTRLTPFFALVTLLAFVFAFGRNSPVFVFLFRHIPTFNLFQAPARWLLLAVFSLSLLAAFGASMWKTDRRGQARARLGLVGACAVIVITLLVIVAVPNRPILNGLLVLGIQLVVVALIFAAQPAQTSAPWRLWAGGVLVIVAADLLWANALNNPTVSAAFYEPRAPIMTGRTFWSDKDLHAAEFDQILLFNDYRIAGQKQEAYRSAGFPNLNLLDRQLSFSTFEPLRPAGIDRLTQLLNEQPATNLFAAAAIGAGAPRVRLVPNSVNTSEPLKAMADPNWEPTQTVFLEGDPPPLNGTPGGTVRIDHETPLEIEMTSDTPGPAALVLADTWYPGWNASLDGAPVPIYRANAAFRAVFVRAGKHQVVMRYQPTSLLVGAALSGLSLLIWITLLVVSVVGAWRNRRVLPPQMPQKIG